MSNFISLPTGRVQVRSINSHNDLKKRKGFLLSDPDEMIKKLKQDLEKRETESEVTSMTTGSVMGGEGKGAKVKQAVEFDDDDVSLVGAEEEEENDGETNKVGVDGPEDILLKRELDRIRKEREASLKDQLNPILDSAKIKKRWDEDVVFKSNNHNISSSSSKPKEFINDTVHSAFHKSFLKKYVKS